MSIFGNDIEEGAMQVHRVHHLTSAIHPDMDNLAVFDQDWLCVREALAVNDVVPTHFTDEHGILHIGLYLLLILGSTGTWVHDKGSIETARNLREIIVVTVVPVCSYILIMYGEIVDIGFTWFNRFLSNARHTVYTARQHKSMPVHRG